MTTETANQNNDAITGNDTGKTDSNMPPGKQLDVIGQQLDHVDEQLHEALRILRALEPLLPLVPDLAPRALALMDPGAAIRAKLPPFLGGKTHDRR